MSGRPALHAQASESAPPSPARGRAHPARRCAAWTQAAIAAPIALALALVYASCVPGLADSDPWSHLQYATQLWRSGLELRGHPFLPFTVLGDSGVDPWLLFHWLLLPFVPLGILWGARIAGACIAACVAGSLAFLLCKAGRRVSWPFALAPLLFSAAFATRGHVARPSHLTIPLLFIELFAGLSLMSAPWAAGAAFAHGLLHLSAPLSPLFAALGAGAAQLARWLQARRAGSDPTRAQRSNGEEQGAGEQHLAARGTPSWRAVVWSIGGLALALVVRPDRAGYLPIALAHDLLALGFGPHGQLPHAGLELVPAKPLQLLLETWPALLLVLLAALLGRGRERSGALASRLALAGASLGLSLLTLRAIRFIDYLAPALALCAGLLWPREEPGSLARSPDPTQSAPSRFALAPRTSLRLLRVALAAAALALMLARMRALARDIPPLFDGPETYAQMAAAVRAKVPPGDVIFTDDPFVTEILYGHLPAYRYIAAYDPAFLYLAGPARFWRWHHALYEGQFCEEERCPGAEPSSAAIIEALRSFDASWVITSYPRGARSMQESMARDAASFELLAIAPGSSNGLYLWRVRP